MRDAGAKKRVISYRQLSLLVGRRLRAGDGDERPGRSGVEVREGLRLKVREGLATLGLAFPQARN